MVITEEIVQVDRTPSNTPNTPNTPRRSPTRRLLGIGTAIVVAAVASIAVVASSGPTQSDKTPVQAPRTRDDIVRDLVARGLVPAETLDDGTHITSPALAPAPRTRDDIVRDLVARGVSPSPPSTTEPRSPADHSDPYHAPATTSSVTSSYADSSPPPPPVPRSPADHSNRDRLCRRRP